MLWGCAPCSPCLISSKLQRRLDIIGYQLGRSTRLRRQSGVFIVRKGLFDVALSMLAIFSLSCLVSGDAALAQVRSEAITATDEASIRLRMNQGTVGLAAGLLDGGFVRFASEMARTIDDGDNIRL